MAWIKVDQHLLAHRKTARLADQLDIPEAQAAGHMIGLWGWAIDNAPDGILDHSDRAIARAAHWYGAPTHFVEAATFAGFIEDDFNGKPKRIHEWEQYAGALIEKRNVDRTRIKRWRDNQKKQRNALRNAYGNDGSNGYVQP
jgi:hypothetical protein